MSSYSFALLSCVVVAVMLMDNGALAQNNNYYYRNSIMPVNRYRPMQSNSIASAQQYKPSNPWAAAAANNNNQINSHVPRSNSNNNNNWGWQAAAVKPQQQQQRWKLDFDDSIEDDSIESSFYRRPSPVPRYQRHSIINNNPHTVTNNNNNNNRAWSRPSPVTARPVQRQQQQHIRWNNRFDDSVEDHSAESREFRRW